MAHLHTLEDFLSPINLHELSDDEGYRDTQLGKHVAVNEGEIPDIEFADIVLVGCGDHRGAALPADINAGPNAIRKQFYSLYHWHSEVSVADIGNIIGGASINDTYAALRTVVNELILHNKRVVILGGSHDLTLAQYGAYVANEQIIEATCVDAKLDLNMDSHLVADNFLMEMLVGEPNFIRHYNHIGFQSYFVHPSMLETIDKLRFDCYRVGRVKQKMEEMEPVIRNSHLFSFDISAIQNCHAPANRITPNGFSGEEACMLMQYAGMSTNVNTIGLYGYLPNYDVHDLTAKQLSHMLWYLMDGIYKGKLEAPLEERDDFYEFRMAFAEIETTFLQSKKTGRWWMEVPDGKMIACSHEDYLVASSNDIPERWMRAAERL
ncbi:formimidoylglutamase [Aridibaculum aurantiacum]|uniref:formimidoylglutamase n=1 Tax=Aridibaculum aurantiacum TaxID=2810307 RepID=UPI001A97349B|nr:formimidoylglutamase [Aridibaculum aurantiacum]